MKKTFNKYFVMSLFGILMIGIVVYATDLLSSSEVSYKTGTVNEALDDLYSKIANPSGLTFQTYVDGTLDNDLSDNGLIYIDTYTCQNGTTVTYNNGKFSFGNVPSKDSCTINMLTVPITSIKMNLNIDNIRSYEADGNSSSNIPENAIDGSMSNGKGRNWHGGTKLLIEYKTQSRIEDIGVYTTDNWGYSFSTATIYYSNDDTLTLDSDLSNFNSIQVATESDVTLDTPINAKRIMLVKTVDQAVYEFKALGYMTQ